MTIPASRRGRLSGSETKHIQHRQLAAACGIGSLTAWILFVAPIAMCELWDNGFSDESWHKACGIVLLLGTFGIPIALFFGFLIGFPFIKIAIRQGKSSYGNAILFGAATGFAIGLLILMINIIYGLGDYFDPSTRGSYGDGDGPLWNNGLPTMRGWLNEGRILVQYSLSGALAGVSVRWSLGPASNTSVDQITAN